MVRLRRLVNDETAITDWLIDDVRSLSRPLRSPSDPRSTQRHENSFFADMHSFIAAMARRFPIQLAIIAGHPAMIGTGPLGGHAVETGIVIASTDAVAADVVGARLLGFEPQGVRHLWEAGRLGLGEANTARMKFPALALRDAIEAFTEAAYGERLTFEHE